MIATFKNDKSVRRTIDIGADVHSSEVDIFVEQSHAGVDVNARFSCDPATADAIASALHVAAAEVRIARGEAAPELTYDARIILNRVDGKDLDVEDVRRIARDLNAWLAAVPCG